MPDQSKLDFLKENLFLFPKAWNESFKRLSQSDCGR